MLKCLTMASLMLASLPGQTNPVCGSVSTEDATAVLGASASRTRDPSGCAWQDATHKRTFNVAYVNVPAMFERARQDSVAKGKTEDEKGLGGPAFSTAPSSYKGDRVALYCLKGATVLILDLEAPGAVSRIQQMRDVMRKLVPK